MVLVVKTHLPVQEMYKMWIRSLGWEDPLEEDMGIDSSFLAWRIPMDRGAWGATYSPWCCKESDMTERLSTAQSNDQCPSKRQRRRHNHREKGHVKVEAEMD